MCPCQHWTRHLFSRRGARMSVATPAPPLRRPDRPLCIGHRGASTTAPENTLASIRAAMTAGSDLVEVDVQRTRDRALVLMHDPTLTRTTNASRVFPDRAPWNVGDFTLAELDRLDAGRWRHPAYTGEPVPTLEQALSLLAGTSTGLVLEVKEPENHPGIVAELAGDLARWPAVSLPS